MSGVRRQQFHSGNLTEIECFLRSHHEGIAIRSADRGLEWGNEAVVTDWFSFNHLWTSGVLRARMGPMPDEFAVGHVRSGTVRWQSETFGPIHTGRGGTSAAVPVGDVEHTVDQADLDIVTLNADQVGRYVEHVCGIAPEAFRVLSLSPVSAAHRRHWNRTAAHVRDDMLGNPVLADSAIVLDNAFRTLATAFLATFPNTALDAMTDPGNRPVRRRVPERTLREISDFLRTHAGEPIGPADIAAAASLPARDVVDGLRRSHGTHPAELLWEARLRGVRADLVEAGPDGSATVAGIAGRWGFTNPGRFRVAYARAFGEIPESTLHRP